VTKRMNARRRRLVPMVEANESGRATYAKLMPCRETPRMPPLWLDSAVESAIRIAHQLRTNSALDSRSLLIPI
jgi:hypothetical protein